MTSHPKISVALERYFADKKNNDKRDVIVVYQVPSPALAPVRGRLRDLRSRLRSIAHSAELQKPMHAKLLKSFHTTSKRSTEPEISTIGNDTLPVAWLQVTPAKLEELAANRDVLAVLPDLRIHPIRPHRVDYTALGKQESKDKFTWGLKKLGIPKLWETTKGKGINVAVLDTGVYGEHSALAGRVKDFVVIDPQGRRIKTQTSFDAGEHGTHVCGTIAGGKTPEGISIGVAPEANLLVAGVLVGNATLRSLLEGISWAVEQGADIINMSLGFSYYEPLFAKVFNILTERYGVLPIAAIGNENYGNSSSPGNVVNALSIGAVELIGGGKTEVAFFSSGASLVFPGDDIQTVVTKPDVVAPGVQVYSSIPPAKRPDGTFEYTYMDGTSMATPHISGVAALLMAAKPGAPLPDIIRVMKETASHPLGKDFRPDNRWGYGLLRPREALKALS
jgi:subtilisin family serine protease